MFIFSKLLSAMTQPVFWLGLWWGFALLILNVTPACCVGLPKLAESRDFSPALKRFMNETVIKQ